MENDGGPSPLVPFLMLGILGLIVYGQMFIVLLPLLLLLFVNLVSTSCMSFGMFCPPRHHTSSSVLDSEGYGYGLGACLLLVLYLVSMAYASSGHQTSSSFAQDAVGYGLKALILLVLYIIGIGYFTNQQQTSSSASHSEGYGLATLLLVVLFYVLVLSNIL